MQVIAVALTGAAASYAVGGAALARRGPWLTGALLAATGGLLLAAGVREGSLVDGTRGLLLLGAAQIAALALVCYPRPSVRHPVELVTVVLVSASAASLLVDAGAESSPALRATRTVTTAVALTVLSLHTWWRLERATPDQRWPLLWMALPAGTALLGLGVVVFVASNTAGAVGLCVLVALVPPALYLGVTRPQLSDVRGLVGGALVVAASLATYLAVLETFDAGLELLVGRPLSRAGLVLLAAICGLVIHPVRTVLRGVVDELLFGHRPDPLRAASRVVDALGDDPAGALAAVRTALMLPYAAVRTWPWDGTAAEGDLVLVSGQPAATLRTVPMPSYDDGAAELVVGLRAGELRLGAADEQVLRLVAPLLAQTLRARAVAAEQRTSRETTIRAVEEERRRLRRDLHDGLGPRLSGIAFTADAARNTVRSDPAAAEALLASVRAETTTAMAEIRQLVYGMRPPALDELGLLPALRQHVATLRTPDERPLQVAYEVDSLPPLPAAWEVAVYRIVAGALDNAARHSGADRAVVRIAADDSELAIEVRDAGCPTTRRVGDAAHRPGVGIASMRERSAELGGSLAAGPDGQGWRVSCQIPLPRDG